MTTPPQTKETPASKKLGEDISFGMQQTFACWATDFIDPYIGKWIQDKYKDDKHNGTLAHTWGGEIVGDSAAFVMYLGVQQLAPEPVHWLKRAAKACLNPLYEWTGRKHLKQWAIHHDIDEDSDAYKRKMEAWKDFQSDNFAKSSVITVSSIAANVATQKLMGNTHKLSIITASKVIGAAITMSTMLGVRFVIPKTTQQLDEELSDNYFAPLIRKTQKLFGTRPDPVPVRAPHKEHMDEAVLYKEEQPPSYAKKIREEKNLMAGNAMLAG